MASKEQFQSFYDSLVTKSNKKTTLFSNVSPRSYWNGSVRTGAGITMVQYTYFATEDKSAIELLIHRKNKDDKQFRDEVKSLYQAITIAILMNAERPYTDLRMNIKYFNGQYKGKVKIFD